MRHGAIGRKAWCAALVLLLAGCSPVQPPPGTGADPFHHGVLDVRLADADKPHHLRAGQRLRVHLPAIPVGVRWLFEGGDEVVLPLEQDPGGRMLDPIDAPAHFVWSFRARRAGRAVLRFSSRRTMGEIAGEAAPAFEVIVE